MPDWMDHLQDQQALASDALQRAGRMPDATPPAARDCDECGDPIPPPRLAAVPTALRCIGCEELHVQRARFMGRPIA